MKLVQPVIITLSAVAGLSSPVEAANLTQLPLSKPLNWLAGPSLFPGNLIAGETANYTQYNGSSWATHVLDKCLEYADCTSTISFSGINSGIGGPTDHVRFWFGYVFRGGPTDSNDYERGPETVTDSVVYTI